MKYPQLSLRESNAPYMEEMKTAAAEVIEGGWYIRGKYVSRLEEQLCAYLGCRYAVATGNGLDALRLMLRAYNGLVPVFVEPSVHTYNLDTSLVERAVTARTRAIMVVHLYGRVCWDECLKDVAARYGLKIVEDNAQAFGAVSPVAGLQGSFHTGALGNAAGLSFYPTKNLGALGDAGAVTTNDGELAEVVRALGNYGSAERYVNLYKGVNSRMDDLQAAFLSVKLKYLDEDNRRRVAVAKAYSEHIHGKEIVLPEPGGEGEHIWHQYVVRCSERDRLKNYLESEGVGTLIHYPIPPHKQQCYREYNQLPLPIAEQLADEVLSLPMSAYLNESDVLEIARIINRFS